MSNPNQVSDELRTIYERCDVSNNGTDDPMSFDEFQVAIDDYVTQTRQSLLAEIAERLPKDRAVLKTTSESAQDYSLGFNAANSLTRKLLTELAEEGDKSKGETKE